MMNVYITYFRYSRDENYTIYHIDLNEPGARKHYKEVDLPEFLSYSPDDESVLVLQEIEMSEEDYVKLVYLSKKVEDYDRETIEFMTSIYDSAQEFIYEDTCETNIDLIDYFIECGKYDMNDYLDPDLDLEDISVDELRQILMDQIWNDEGLYNKVLKDFIKENY